MGIEAVVSKDAVEASMGDQAAQARVEGADKKAAASDRLVEPVVRMGTLTKSIAEEERG